MNLPAHSSLKCDHGTYEPTRSYPHTRVQQIRTSPPASITHLKSPLRTSPLVTNPTYAWPSYQEKKTSMQIHLQRNPVTALPPSTFVWIARRTVPEHLAVSLCRRAPPYQQPSLFVAYHLAELVLPPGATPVETLFYWFRHFQGLPTTCNHSALHPNHQFQIFPILQSSNHST